MSRPPADLDGIKRWTQGTVERSLGDEGVETLSVMRPDAEGQWVRWQPVSDLVSSLLAQLTEAQEKKNWIQAPGDAISASDEAPLATEQRGPLDGTPNQAVVDSVQDDLVRDIAIETLGCDYWQARAEVAEERYETLSATYLSGRESVYVALLERTVAALKARAEAAEVALRRVSALIGKWRQEAEKYPILSRLECGMFKGCADELTAALSSPSSGPQEPQE